MQERKPADTTETKKKPIKSLLTEQLARMRRAGNAGGETWTREAERSRLMGLGATRLLEIEKRGSNAEALIAAGRGELERQNEHRLQQLRNNGAKRRATKRADTELKHQPGATPPQQPNKTGPAYVSVVDFSASGRTAGLLQPSNK